MHRSVTALLQRFNRSDTSCHRLFSVGVMFWALKAFFCSNIKSVFQSNSQLPAVKARDAMHGFVFISMVNKITYMHLRNYRAITYVYLSVKR